MILSWTTNHMFNPRYSLETLSLGLKNKKGVFNLGLLVLVLILKNRKSWFLFLH